jgi:phospholipid-binding lipoprotein MlaA
MLNKLLRNFITIFSVLIASTLLMGCGKKLHPADPLEPLNRGTYRLNKGVDRLFIKPTARAYELFIPKPIRYLVGNFFQNLSEIPNILNDLLQGQFTLATKDSARFLINSTWGIGGLVDVAAGRGKIPKNNQDFGKTLAHWGYKESSYFVIPLLGPSTLRDTFGRGVTFYMSVWPYIHCHRVRNTLFLVYLTDLRAELLKAEPLIGESVDEYIFVRDAYLQNRKYQIEGKTAGEATSQLEGPPE